MISPDTESLSLHQLERDERVRVVGRVPRWKRALDVALILAATPLLLPVSLLIAFGIKLVSPGPVLFKQERVGYRGRRFTCFKFRSMVVNADASVHQGHLATLMKSDQPMVKLDAKGDQRVIPGGIWLRSSGLDELPQLLNVLHGDMSLVGPRPCVAYEYEHYTARHRRRLETLPGLTGLWQVKGKNRTTFEEMIDLDIQYVDNKSLFLDMTIIARTIPAIVVQVIEQRLMRKRAVLPGEDVRVAPGDHSCGRVP